MNKLYTTIKTHGTDEFEEKKSLFIGQAKHIDSQEEATAFVKAVKQEYSDATHNVWAYILEGGRVAKCSDDGEPQGTGGVPILETIKKCGVEDAVVVVTRYFGGVLLGTGGLVRAYSHGAKIALEASEIITYEKYEVYGFECSYSDYQKCMFLLPQFDVIIDSTDFAEQVKVQYATKEEVSQPLIDKISELSGGKIRVEFIEQRYDFK